jgi:hypothetical protein
MMRLMILPALVVAGVICAPVAHTDGDPSVLPPLIEQVYTEFQTRCTPQTPPDFQRIEWASPPTGGAARGTVVDANPSLGGPFIARWNATTDSSAQFQVSDGGSGYWDITFEFC